MTPCRAGAVTLEKRRVSKQRKPIEWHDLAVLSRLPLWGLVAWLLPQAWWPHAAAWLAGPVHRPSAAIRQAAARLGVDADQVTAQLDAHRIEHSFQYLRDYRPGGWQFETDVRGLPHLETARASGKGVILWMAHCVFHGLAVKKRLHELGVQVHHLSRAEHGYSKTAFGIHVLNPIRARREDRYLAGRIAIADGVEERAMRTALRQLRAGAIISITAGAWEGRQIAVAPLAGCVYPLATGAPALAHATGAALIPVFCCHERRSAGGRRLIIELSAPLAVPRQAPRDQAMAAAVGQFAGLTEAFMRAHPDDWRGWKYLRLSPIDPA
ncbi:MAG: hypothetical protein ACFB3T_03025 [Geminicoccaceae bacterium]